MDWHGSPWNTPNSLFLSFWASLLAPGQIGRASSEHKLLVTTGVPKETRKTTISRELEFAWLESHGKLGKAVVWRKYLGKKPLIGPVHHNSWTNLNWSRDRENKRKTTVSRMIWKQAQGDEDENRKYRAEDTGAGCTGNQTEYMRGNMIQWRKETEHSVWVSTVFTNYWKFVSFQQVFGASVWIDWMPEINIQFLLTLVELQCTFLFPLQVTAIKAVIDARKSVQLMLLQTVKLSFSAVDTGSQFPGHKSEHMHISWKHIKALQGTEEVLTSTCTWDPEHWGSNLPSELNESWVEEKFEFYIKWHIFFGFDRKKPLRISFD